MLFCFYFFECIGVLNDLLYFFFVMKDFNLIRNNGNGMFCVDIINKDCCFVVFVGMKEFKEFVLEFFDVLVCCKGEKVNGISKDGLY